jgi:hypothetical protein
MRLFATAARAVGRRNARMATAALLCIATLGASLIAATGEAQAAAPRTIEPGKPATVELKLSQPVRLLFRAPLGRHVTLVSSRSRVSGLVFVAVTRPDGSSAGSGFLDGNQYVEPAFTEQAGNWSLAVSASTGSGSLRLTLGLVADQAGTIAPGSARVVSVPTPGQDVVLSFPGASGQRPTLQLDQISWQNTLSPLGATVVMTLVRPDGSFFGVPTGGQIAAPLNGLWQQFTAGTVDGDGTLDATGTWTLRIEPFDATVGSMSVQLDLVADQVTELIPGQPITATITHAFQQFRLVLPATSGQRVSLTVTRADWASLRTGQPTAASLALGSSASASPPQQLSVGGPGTYAFPAPLDADGVWILALFGDAIVGAQDMTVQVGP